MTTTTETTLRAPAAPVAASPVAAHRAHWSCPSSLTVKDLAELLDQSPIDVIKTADASRHHGQRQPGD